MPRVLPPPLPLVTSDRAVIIAISFDSDRALFNNLGIGEILGIVESWNNEL